MTPSRDWRRRCRGAPAERIAHLAEPATLQCSRRRRTRCGHCGVAPPDDVSARRFTTPTEEILARMRGVTWALEAAMPGFEHALETLSRRSAGIRCSCRPPRAYRITPPRCWPQTSRGAVEAAAASLWAAAGLDARKRSRALLPLLRGAVERLAGGRLAGRTLRADRARRYRHGRRSPAWLDTHATRTGGAALRDAYRALGQLAIPLAQAKGTLAPADAAALRDLCGRQASRRAATRPPPRARRDYMPFIESTVPTVLPRISRSSRIDWWRI